jgi:hypothetical protein
MEGFGVDDSSPIHCPVVSCADETGGCATNRVAERGQERSEAVNEEQLRVHQDLPTADSQRLIDFERAQILTLESFPPQFVLRVTGTKPFLNMEVQLEPLVFIRQPEFWGIEVVGRLPGGIGLPALAPYDVTIPLSGITGTKGIEVIGASRSKKIKVPSTEPEPPGFPEANLFQVRGREGVRITYGILRARGEFLDYRDRERDLSFSAMKGEIDTFESTIGRMLTVALNRDEANADADLITLTLLLPRINLEGQREDFETLAIETTHLSGFRPRPAKGPQQFYRALSLEGTASQAD